MNTASKGRRLEHIVRDMLIEEGYEVVRCAGSKGGNVGPIDLVALSPHRMPSVVLVSVKCAQWPGNREMRLLSGLAARYGGIAERRGGPSVEVRVYRKQDRKAVETRVVKVDIS